MLGAYEILSAIGAGGMGEVYRARDTKLDRDVAIKILPEALAADPDRIARFEREAKTLAALNHPNIAHIHGLEESSGTRALVMEFVDGPTLAERIAKRPVPLEEALPIARQIAEALEAAHEQGIVHRDLKPANIKLRPDGTVKVLDFGLAKALTVAPGFSPAADRSPEGLRHMASESPTLTSPAMTQMGVILGTAAYMSPEQARGRAVDKRTDIWAFGCVLFEMLTGRRAFEAGEVTDTIVAVVSRDPEWAHLPAAIPHPIRQLLTRCLVKDPKNRLPDIAAARLDIDDAARADARYQEVPPQSGVMVRSTRHAWVPWGLALASLAMAVWATGSRFVGSASGEPALVRFVLQPPPGTQFTGPLAVSPDGRRIVFRTAGDREQGEQLWIRDLDSVVARPLPDTRNAAFPF